MTDVPEGFVYIGNELAKIDRDSVTILGRLPLPNQAGAIPRVYVGPFSYRRLRVFSNMVDVELVGRAELNYVGKLAIMDDMRERNRALQAHVRRLSDASGQAAHGRARGAVRPNRR